MLSFKLNFCNLLFAVFWAKSQKAKRDFFLFWTTRKKKEKMFLFFKLIFHNTKKWIARVQITQFIFFSSSSLLFSKMCKMCEMKWNEQNDRIKCKKCVKNAKQLFLCCCCCCFCFADVAQHLDFWVIWKSKIELQIFDLFVEQSNFFKRNNKIVDIFVSFVSNWQFSFLSTLKVLLLFWVGFVLFEEKKLNFFFFLFKNKTFV